MLKCSRCILPQRGESAKQHCCPVGAPSGTANGYAVLQPGASEPGYRWHSRCYLTHFESPGAVQRLTYHLADSLPRAAREDLQAGLLTLPSDQRKIALRQGLQDILDDGYGCRILREPQTAKMVQDSFLHFDGRRYRLFFWVVMPNHVHVLIQSLEG